MDNSIAIKRAITIHSQRANERMNGKNASESNRKKMSEIESVKQ